MLEYAKSYNIRHRRTGARSVPLLKRCRVSPVIRKDNRLFNIYMQIELSDHFNFKKLMRFIMPSMLMMVVVSIYGVIDGFFVSNYVGKTAFAALNLVIPFSMILGGTGFMIGTGGTALVSKVQGEGDKEKADRYFTMLIIFAAALGVVLTAAGVAVMRPVSYLLGATEDMIEYCVLYGRVLIAFNAFFMLQNIFQSFLAAAGKPKLGLTVTIIAGCANALLDALFIVVFKWGLAGAALARASGR